MLNTRVKIPRTVLIERIQAEIDKRTAEHEAEVEVYGKKMLALREKLGKEIKEAADKIPAFSDQEFIEFAEANLYTHRYSQPQSYFGVSMKIPEKPYPLDLDHLEKSKRVLEASTDDVISVSSRDDYYHYL